MPLQDKGITLFICHLSKKLFKAFDNNKQLVPKQYQVSVLWSEHLSYNSDRSTFYDLEPSKSVIVVKLAWKYMAMPACCARWSITQQSGGLPSVGVFFSLLCLAGATSLNSIRCLKITETWLACCGNPSTLLILFNSNQVLPSIRWRSFSRLWVFK